MNTSDMFLKEATEHYKHRLLSDPYTLRSIPSYIVYLLPIISLSIIFALVLQMKVISNLDQKYIKVTSNTVQLELSHVKNKISNHVLRINNIVITNEVDCETKSKGKRCYRVPSIGNYNIDKYIIEVLYETRFIDEII